MNPTETLTPRQKAAILIMSLPSELSAQVIRTFPPEEVQALTLEMSKTSSVSPETKDSVIKEFLETTELQSETLPGQEEGKPFSFLRRADPKQLSLLMKEENPQTIALVLSYLDAEQATAILQEIKLPLQTEIARRLALAEIHRVRPEVVQTVEKTLKKRYHELVDHGFPQSNGRETLVEILNRSDRTTEEKILSGLSRKNPKLAEDLKSQLCEFEALLHMERSAIQHLLKVTDMRDLVLALKGASSEISGKIYEALPTERAKAIQEDVETLKVTDWEEIRAAQQQIRNNLRGLIVIGKIKMPAPPKS